MDKCLINRTNICLLRGDITKQCVDAIVNAANSDLIGVGGRFAAGVDGAIHRVGGSEILSELRKIRQVQGPCRVGEAIITSAGRLQARHVIHAVGPVWCGGEKQEAVLLASAYRKSLELATEFNDASIAFPSLSTGAFGYPTALAARVALATVAQYCRGNKSLTEVRFVLFDDVTYRAYQNVLTELYE